MRNAKFDAAFRRTASGGNRFARRRAAAANRFARLRPHSRSMGKACGRKGKKVPRKRQNGDTEWQMNDKKGGGGGSLPELIAIQQLTTYRDKPGGRLPADAVRRRPIGSGGRRFFQPAPCIFQCDVV